MATKEKRRPEPPLTQDTRWLDAKGREWRILEKLPAGRNLCTTTDRRYQGDWTTREIRSALAARKAAPPQLYLAGHNVRRGQAVMRQYQEGDEARYYASLTKARAVVERFNRMALRRHQAAAVA